MSHIHLPDGVLPVWLWALGWLVTLVAVTVAGRIAERVDIRRRVPLLAVISALMIVAMSSEIVPLAYHVNLTVIGGVLLGPVLSVIAAFIVEVVLALLGHGGVTVFGLNTVMIAAEMVLGWLLFRGLVLVFGRTRVRPAAFSATVVTLAVTTSLLVGIVALGGASATTRETGALDPSTLKFGNPLSGGVLSVGLFGGGETPEKPPAEAGAGGLSVGRFAAVVYTLGPLGWVLEGLLSAWLLGYVARMRPGLLWGAYTGRSGLAPQGDEGVS